MAKARRSKKTLPPEKVAELSKLAKQVDERDRDDIVATGRRIFAQHERLAEIMHRLKAERESQQISLSEMARRIGSDAANLHRLENSPHANPTIQTLERYAQALGKGITIAIVDEAA